MARLTPLRWLAANGAAAALYVGCMLSSGVRIPPQINSVALTVAAVAITVPALAALADQRDRVLRAELDHYAGRIYTQNAVLVRRLGAVQADVARVAMLAPTQPLPILRAVGTATIEKAYDDGFVDGLARRPGPPGVEATVTKIDAKRS